MSYSAHGEKKPTKTMQSSVAPARTAKMRVGVRSSVTISLKVLEGRKRLAGRQWDHADVRH